MDGGGMTELEEGAEAPVTASTAGTAKKPAKLICAISGKERPRRSEGELRLRGPQCFSGYVDGSLDADALDDERDAIRRLAEHSRGRRGER